MIGRIGCPPTSAGTWFGRHPASTPRISCMVDFRLICCLARDFHLAIAAADDFLMNEEAAYLVKRLGSVGV